MKNIVLFTLIIFISINSKADLLIETMGLYESDSLAMTTSNSGSKTFYNFGFLYSIKSNLWGGWNYMSLSQSDTMGSTTTSFAPVDTGPSIKYFFGRGEVFSVGMTYNFQSTASYTSGSTNQTWSGTSYLMSFGITPALTDTLHIGLSINYYSASYSKKVVNSTESSASNSKTLIFPAFSLTKSW